MAKTNSETIRELEVAVGAIQTRIEILDRDQVAETARGTEADSRLTEAISLLRERVAVLDQIIAELKRNAEESERRRWQFILLFLGSVLTLIVNLLLFAFRGK